MKQVHLSTLWFVIKRRATTRARPQRVRDCVYLSIYLWVWLVREERTAFLVSVTDRQLIHYSVSRVKISSNLYAYSRCPYSGILWQTIDNSTRYTDTVDISAVRSYFGVSLFLRYQNRKTE